VGEICDCNSVCHILSVELNNILDQMSLVNQLGIGYSKVTYTPRVCGAALACVHTITFRIAEHGHRRGYHPGQHWASPYRQAERLYSSSSMVVR
jgi:hypothetical protein